jgi:hypothetical protein
VLLSRDLIFQSCLAEARLGLNADERRAHYQALLDLLAKVNANSLEGKNIENENESGDQNVVLPGQH